LIEDNPDHAELMIRGFEDHPRSSRILHLSDGEAALDYLLRRGYYSDPKDSPRPAVVLLDLRIPKVDGLEVLETIRTRPELDRVAVVILSTSKAEPDVMRAYANQANSYLVKPMDFASFTELIRILGDYWLGWNQECLRRQTALPVSSGGAE
jgi:CheY-like chemotaxis protein